MSEHILPNQTYVVENSDGTTFYFNGCFDVLMYFAPLDVHWVRYYDEEDKDDPIKMVVLPEKNAETLLEQTNLPYLVRETLYRREHDGLIQILGQWITESQLELDIDEQWVIDDVKRQQED